MILAASHPLRLSGVGARERLWDELMVIRNYVNVTSNIGWDEVVCFFNLIFHAGLG